MRLVCGCAERRAREPGAGEHEGAQVPQRVGGRVLPRPLARCPQRLRLRAVDAPTGQGHSARADPPSDSWSVTVIPVESAQEPGPAEQVVGKTARESQAALAEKLPEGQCSMPAPSLEVSDVELCLGALATEGIDLDGDAGQIADESEVAPVGPQLTWDPTSRVRRTMRRLPLKVVSATVASTPSR